MDLRRLTFLARIIEVGSITRAAQKIGISQPALSQHIQLLEREFGARLLIRSANGVSTTPAGAIVYRNARMLLRQAELVRTEVRAASGTPSGRVTLGIAPHSPARRIVQPLLMAVRTRHPDVILHVVENFEGLLTADLLVKRLDMALLYEVVPRDDLLYTPLGEETLRLVGPASLLPPGKDAADIPLLLPGPSSALRQLVDAGFARQGGRPLVLAEIESFDTLVSAVGAGLGATVLPQGAAREVGRRQGLRTRAFGGPATRLTLFLCTAAENPSPAMSAVRALAEDLMRGQDGGAVPQGDPP